MNGKMGEFLQFNMGADPLAMEALRHTVSTDQTFVFRQGNSGKKLNLQIRNPEVKAEIMDPKP